MNTKETDQSVFILIERISNCINQPSIPIIEIDAATHVRLLQLTFLLLLQYDAFKELMID